MVEVFFFQAEDGIRDLVRSRGLGDVYKRQLFGLCMRYRERLGPRIVDTVPMTRYAVEHNQRIPVSYTHLTLPTIYSV